MKTIINCETGEITQRELNAEELAQLEIDNSLSQAMKAAREVEEQAKATARAALLAQLGITEEQARLLLS